MLDRLPPKVIRLVLDHAARSIHAFDGYSKRQAFLLSCCLVSRNVLPVARELLWEVVRIRSSAVLVSVERAARWVGGNIKTLDVASRDRKVCLRALALLEDLPALENLYFDYGGDRDEVCVVGIKELDAIGGLHRLALAGVTITPPQLPSFPNLVALSLREVDIPFASSVPYLRTEQLPSLRALHASHHAGSPPVLTPSPALFTQLALTVIDIGRNGQAVFSAPLTPADPPRLFSGDVDSLCFASEVGGQRRWYTSTDLPHFFELRLSPPSSFTDHAQAVEFLTASLRAVDYLRARHSDACRAVVLPLSLSPTYLRLTGIELDKGVQVVRDSILAQCEKDQVKVFWRGREEEGGEGEMLPQEDCLVFAAGLRKESFAK